MENNSTVPQHNIEEEEIDILALVLRLWEKKWFIVKVTCVFAILGFFVAIFTPEEYTASCVVVQKQKGEHLVHHPWAAWLQWLELTSVHQVEERCYLHSCMTN